MAFARSVLGTLLVVGAGALAIGVIIAAPKLLRAARPTAREALRRGLGLYERVRNAAAEVAEDVEDMVAEVQADLRPDPQSAAPLREAKEA
jgi:hypothetical protein